MRGALFLRVMSQEMRSRLSYRLDFWINAVVGFFAQFGLVYFVWEAMFAESGLNTIGGYDFGGMVLYYLTVTVLGRWVGGRELEGQVSSDIYEGGINRYLLFPAGYLPFKYAQHLGAMIPSALPFLLLGGFFVALLDLPTAALPGPSEVLMVLPALVLANLLHYLIGYPIQLVAFWADNVWSLDVGKRFLLNFLGGVALPLSVFPGWAEETLGYLPFAFVYSFPTRILLGQVGLAEWAVGMGLASTWCVAFWAVGRVVWRRGQLQYSGIGI